MQTNLNLALEFISLLSLFRWVCDTFTIFLFSSAKYNERVVLSGSFPSYPFSVGFGVLSSFFLFLAQSTMKEL